MDRSAKMVKVFIRELSSKSKLWVGFAFLKIEGHWSSLSDTFIQPISLTVLIWCFFSFLDYLFNFYLKQNTLCCHLAPQGLVVNRLNSQNSLSIDLHPFLRKKCVAAADDTDIWLTQQINMNKDGEGTQKDIVHFWWFSIQQYCSTKDQSSKKVRLFFLSEVVFSPVWFWFLSVMGVKGKYMSQALGIIRGSKAERHPEPQPVYLPRPMLQSRN